MATINQIRQALSARPFQAFTLYLADGRTCFVRHPDFIAIPPAPHRREIVYWSDGETHLIDPGLIVSIVMPTPDQASQNQAATTGPSEPRDEG
jgi:hypothetical protein